LRCLVALPRRIALNFSGHRIEPCQRIVEMGRRNLMIDGIVVAQCGRHTAKALDDVVRVDSGRECRDIVENILPIFGPAVLAVAL
jgi:hypothetical protein